MKKKNVVIIGGGFGGVSCAKTFATQFPHFNVTLIDQNSHHVLHSNLYELATAAQEITDMRILKQTVAIPIANIFEGTSVKFQQGKVISIDSAKQLVQLEHGTIAYDYLITALGAQANFYGIPGAEQYSIPLQSVGDALRIRDRIEFAVQAHRHDTKKDVIRLMIAGGGVAGIEVAAELQGMLDFVAWKNNYTRAKLETVVIEGTGQLLPGFPDKVSKDTAHRLENFGIRTMTNRMIAEVDQNLVTFSNGEKLEYDCLIWTAGVKANPLPLSKPPVTSRGDRVEVDEFFRVNGFVNIFVLGDQTCHHMPNGNPLPGTASQAIDQGKYVATTINARASNKQPDMHSCREYPFLIPLGGKWGIYSSKQLYLKGYLPYLIRQMVWFKYCAGLVGWIAALQWLFVSTKQYNKNDK